MRISKRRVLIAGSGLLGLAAVAMIVTGSTFGFFATSKTSGTNKFTTGTVTLAPNASATHTCTVTNMEPGDESTGYSPSTTHNTQGTKDTTCKFSVKYTGSVAAYIGLSTTLTGTLGSSIKWEVSQGSTDTNPGAFATSGTIKANTGSNPLFVGKATTSGTVYTFWVDYNLPSTVTTQSLTQAVLKLTVTAVQAGNNGSTATCTVGTKCPVGAGITW